MAAKEKMINDSIPMEPLVEAAMRSNGWLLPTTDEAVVQLEAELLASAVELPESLKSPAMIFEEISQPPARRAVPSTKSSTPTTANLALAAREGGQILDEVRDMMNHDREVTEREHDLRHKDGTTL